MLGGTTWNLPTLCEVNLDGNCHTSRAWAYDGVQTPLLAGIARDALTRWNGLPGLVAVGALHDKAGGNLTAASNLLAVSTGLAGAGRVAHRHRQRHLPLRLLRLAWPAGARRTSYDPVAERLLFNLLQYGL